MLLDPDDNTLREQLTGGKKCGYDPDILSSAQCGWSASLACRMECVTLNDLATLSASQEALAAYGCSQMSNPEVHRTDRVVYLNLSELI